MTDETRNQLVSSTSADATDRSSVKMPKEVQCAGCSSLTNTKYLKGYVTSKSLLQNLVSGVVPWFCEVCRICSSCGDGEHAVSFAFAIHDLL